MIWASSMFSKSIYINGNTLGISLHGSGCQLSRLEAEDALGTKRLLLLAGTPPSTERL